MASMVEQMDNMPGMDEKMNYLSGMDASTVILEDMGMFPEDSWMLKMLGMSLGLNETKSGEFLKQLKNESPDQKGVVSLTTKENVDFPAVYTYLNQSSIKTVTGSDTWNEDKFYRNGKIGCIQFVIPETTITRTHNSNKYNIYVSSSGFIRTDIDMTEIELLPEAREIAPEQAIPTVMYEDLGGLKDAILKVREMIEIPLKYPELFDRLGIEAPKGVLLHVKLSPGQNIVVIL